MHAHLTSPSCTGVGLGVPLFNGGGTGSFREAAEDPSLTEVTMGSGFLQVCCAVRLLEVYIYICVCGDSSSGLFQTFPDLTHTMHAS